MDPISLILSNVIPSKACELIIGELASRGIDKFIKQFTSIPNIEQKLDSAYDRAVSKWTNNDGGLRYAYKNKYENRKLLVSYILDQSPIGDKNIISLLDLWLEELYKDSDCAQCLQTIKIDDILGKIKDSLGIVAETNKLTKEIYDNVVEFHPLGSSEIKRVNGYIPRNIEDRTSNSFDPINNRPNRLIDYIVNDKITGKHHFILYANPQMGKTTELKNLAFELLETGNFVPILYEVGITNIDERKLPHKDNYEGVPYVILIDALDEISIKKYFELLKTISAFSRSLPNVFIVLSCRQNYESMNNILNSDFEPLYLQPLSKEQIEAFVNSSTKLRDKAGFLYELNKNKLYKFAGSPFYLNRMIEIYENNVCFSDSKIEIYDYFINQALNKEEKKSIEVPPNASPKNDIIQLLKEIAASSLYLNKVYLTEEEIRKTANERFDLIRDNLHLGILNHNPQNNTYSFEFNELREYLAALFLSQCDFEKVRILCTAEDGISIRPQWVNTIKLYVEIKARENRSYIPDYLLHWLEGSSKQILVQLPLYLFDPNYRSDIVISIFEDYKREDHYIDRAHSDIFKDIMRFGQNEKTILYICEELEQCSTYNNHLFNILAACQFINWDDINKSNPDLRNRIFTKLISFIDNPIFDKRNEFVSILWLDNPQIQNEITIDKIISKSNGYPSRIVSQWLLRAIFYAKLPDKYFDFVISVCLPLADDRNDLSSRYYISMLLGMVKDPNHIKKALDIVASNSFKIYGHSEKYLDDSELILLKESEDLFDNGDANIVGVVKNAFIKHFKDRAFSINFHDKKELIDAYKIFFQHTDSWDDFIEQFEEIINPKEFVISPELIELKEKEEIDGLTELLEEARFVSKIKEFETNSNLTSNDLYKLMNEGKISKYIYSFLMRYQMRISSDSSSFLINTSKACTDISNPNVYNEFCLHTVCPMLLGEIPAPNVDQKLIDNVKQLAINVLVSLCSRKFDGTISSIEYYAVKLYINGHISLEENYFSGLLDYIGFSIGKNIDNIGNLDDLDDTYEAYYSPLFERIKEIKENIDKDSLKIIVGDKLKELSDYPLEESNAELIIRTYSILAKYGLDQVIDETAKNVVKRIETNIIVSNGDLIRLLVNNNKEIDTLKEFAERGIISNEEKILLCQYLHKKNRNIHDRWIKELLSKEFMNYQTPFERNSAAELLLSLDDESALDYVINNTSFWEYGHFDSDSYHDIKFIDKLLDLIKSVAPLNSFHNPLSVICLSIDQIAIQSKENLDCVKSKLEQLKQALPTMSQFISEWIKSIDFHYSDYKKRKEGINEALEWMRLK